MRTALFRGGLTVAASITSGAVAYAARNDVFIVVWCVLMVTLLFFFLTYAKEEF